MDHCPVWAQSEHCTCPFYSENCPTAATFRMFAEDHDRNCTDPDHCDQDHPCAYLTTTAR